MSEWLFYIRTFGCKINQCESQLLREAWQKKGGIETDQPELADYILINSCAITGRAERNARNAVFRLKKLAPGAKVILCGCAAQFYDDFQPRKKANRALPDLCVPQKEKGTLLAGPRPAAMPDAPLLTGYYRARPVIRVQDGCSQGCSYCIVPLTRGKSRSREHGEILEECQGLARAGYGELVLSGINLRQYHDKGDFWSLLAWLDRELSPEFQGRLRLRISSIDPHMLDDRGLATLAQGRLVCPHLHLSLQHASEPILRAMGRRHYTIEKVLDQCRKLASLWPVFGLGADFITGFPGETERDVNTLLEAIEELPLTYAHIFPYSRRQGTVAASLPGQIVKKEKERRAWQARAKIAAKQKRFWAAQGELSEMWIVADSDQSRGVNEYYAPCVFREPVPPSHGQIKAEPVGLCEEGLLVKAIKKSGQPARSQ